MWNFIYKIGFIKSKYSHYTTRLMIKVHAKQKERISMKTAEHLQCGKSPLRGGKIVL